jgi:hypothetical protein
MCAPKLSCMPAAAQRMCMCKRPSTIAQLHNTPTVLSAGSEAETSDQVLTPTEVVFP